jgi:hypothetical protein
MIWQDLLLDRWIDEVPLRGAVASIFGVPSDRVAVVDSTDELSEVPAEDALVIADDVKVVLAPQILLERVRQQRDFPLQLIIVLRDETLPKRFVGVEGVLRVAHSLAERLQATVLFAEGPLAPSEWVRVRPTGEVDVVSLDIDDEGDADSFFLVDERTLLDGQSTDAPSPSRRSA